MTVAMDMTLPYQMDVYFDDLPALDPLRVQKALDGYDPGQPPCVMHRVPDSALPGQSGAREPAREACGSARLESFAAQLGDLWAIVMLHSMPSPASGIVEGSRLKPESKARLLAHRAFALVTCFNAGTHRPFENVIFMHKLAMAMCEQGALGAAMIHTGIVLPKEALLGLACASRQGHGNSPGARAADTVWSSVRRMGGPMRLFADVGTFEDRGRHYMATRGFSFCGFPDLICPLGESENPADVAAMFEDAFSYMMVNGPVIGAGHKMATGKSAAFRFDKPPRGVDFPSPPYANVLCVTREPRRKFFGLLA